MLDAAVSSLPPLGEVPRSGKGGVAGNFESLPFNEPHPLSQPLRAASSPIGEPRKPPLKGLAGVAVLDGVQLLNAKLRTAHRAGGVSRGTQNTISEVPRRIRTIPRCPLWGKCRAAAKGVSLVILSCCHSSNNTPSVSLAGSEVPSSLPAPPTGEPSGLLRIRPRFHKTAGAYRNPSATR